MTTEEQAIREALDEVQNPFGRPTPAQEKLVLAAAEKWADALSTPPADEVREALGDAIHNAMNTKFDIGFISDAILTDFEVRPRGAVASGHVSADDAWDSYRFSNWINPQREPYTKGIFRAGFSAARGDRS